MGAPENGYRVGARQWRVLMTACDAWPGGITFSQAREAIGLDFTPAQTRAALRGLLHRGILVHTCSYVGHDITERCQVRITELGASSRLGDQGGWTGRRSR